MTRRRGPKRADASGLRRAKRTLPSTAAYAGAQFSQNRGSHQCGAQPSLSNIATEVVSPVDDFAAAERQDGDIPVAVSTPSTDNVALGGVLEHHDAFDRVVVNGQIKATVKYEP